MNFSARRPLGDPGVVYWRHATLDTRNNGCRLSASSLGPRVRHGNLRLHITEHEMFTDLCCRLECIDFNRQDFIDVIYKLIY